MRTFTVKADLEFKADNFKEACVIIADYFLGIAGYHKQEPLPEGVLEIEPMDDDHMCTIMGSEIDFKPISVPPWEIREKCKDIWKHPEKYSSYPAGTEEAFNRFTKFLWVRFPDGKEERLADVAKGKGT